MRKKLQLLCSFLVIGVTYIQAQTISGKIIDEETQAPLPYTTIKYGENNGAISNEEGDFNITLTKQYTEKDSVYFSSIGYATKALPLGKNIDTLIVLKPEAVELSSVYLTNEKLTADEIIDRVEENLTKNYNKNYTKNRFFMRESFNQYYKKLNFQYKKSSIKEITKGLIDSMISTIPKRTAFHNETLGDFYAKKDETNNKVTILKTSKLYNKNQEVSFEGLQDKFMEVLNKNVKKDSYLKIKSGLFGTKVSVDSIVNTAKNSEEIKDNYEQNNYFFSRKKSLTAMVNRLFYEEDSEVNVIHKSNRYDFVLEDYVFIEDNFCYVIAFTPGRFEDLGGKLYINTEDFAVLRIDYKNTGLVYDKVFNMLGVNINHMTFKGTMIFSKSTDNTYRLKYVSHTNGRSFKLDRPLTVIEKNKHVKGRRKQNELKLQMQFNIIDLNKKELIVFDNNKVTNHEYNAIKETKKVDVKYFSSYNADFWKGYNIIEPNQAIKEFTAF